MYGAHRNMKGRNLVECARLEDLGGDSVQTREDGEVNELDALGISNLGRTNYGWNGADERSTDAYTQEFQLTGDAFDDRLSYVVGVYGFHEETDKGAHAAPSGPFYNSLNNPNLAFYQNTVTELLTRNSSFSAFSQTDWRFDDY